MSGVPKQPNHDSLNDDFTRFFNSVKSKRAIISEKIKTCPRQVELAVKLAKVDLELSIIDEERVEKNKFVGARAVSKRKFSCIMRFLKDKENKELDKKVNLLIHR